MGEGKLNIKFTHGNFYMKKHLSNGFKYGIIVGAITSLAICIAVGLLLSIINFNVANLLLFFSLTIVFTLISAVAFGIIGSIVNLLFHLSRNLIRGVKCQGQTIEKPGLQKSQNKGISKTPDSGRESTLSIDIRSSDENSSQVSTPTSSNVESVDSGISSGNEESDKQNNIVYKTMEKKNYEYWLQQSDIAYIAKVQYQWTECSSPNEIFFCIPGNVDTLNEQVKEYKN